VGVDRPTGDLVEVLHDARGRGFLGPGPVEAHVAHALPLVAVLPDQGTVVDLGSGGGVPALVLALARPGLSWVLVEGRQRRAQWLAAAADRLGLGDRVTVCADRAEQVGRGPWRSRAAAVTARSFGPPAVTAECAAPLLELGGTCWVSEPPAAGPDRWPPGGLEMLGLVRRPGGEPPGWAGLDLVRPCPDRYPRRVGIPAKRPLF
jgi:16S rRNA (guanine527-N7)-methyltransferase